MRKALSKLAKGKAPLVFVGIVSFGLMGVYLLSQTMAAPNENARTYKGQEALSKIGREMPEVAKKFGTSQIELERILLSDNTLEIDENNNPLYTEELVLSEKLEEPSQTSNSPILDVSTMDALNLNSLPNAKLTIFLDFDGAIITDTSWNRLYGLDTIEAPAFNTDDNPTSFNEEERQSIINIWAMVAEDYAPFNVNVTTQDPGFDAINRSDSNDDIYGSTVLISPETATQNSCGCSGRSYVNVFNRTTNHSNYQPVWVYSHRLSNSSKFIGEAASHELGHNIGLSHDGTTTSSYYSGSSGWAPIMGYPLSQKITQFSIGEYANANNQQDDIQIITNVLSLKNDDIVNDIIDSKALNINNGDVDDGGIISYRDDKDVFRFQANGNVNLVATSVTPIGDTRVNLDVKMSLLDSNKNVIAVADEPPDLLSNPTNEINATLQEGTYYIEIDGVGYGDPISPGNYSDYGSLGRYTITGFVNNNGVTPNSPPLILLSATPISGESPLTVNFTSTGTSDPDGDNLSYIWDFGDGAESNLSSPSHVYTTSGNYNVTLTVTDYRGLASSKSLQITVSPDISSPTTPPNFKASLSENSVSLTWGISTDAAGIESYEIYRNNIVLASVQPSTGIINTYTDNNVTAGNDYAYYIRAKDTNGNLSNPTNTINLSVPEPVDTTPPSAPGNLQASASGTNLVNLTWMASTDNVGVITYYVIRNGVTIAEVGKVLSYSDSSVNPNTQYRYNVKAGDAAGNTSTLSNAATLTTPQLPDNEAPSAPSSLSATAIGTNQVNLNWEPSNDNVGVSSYEVYRDNTVIASVSGTSYGDTGLSPDTNYSYFVRAVDAAGNESTNSQIVSVKTGAIVPSSTAILNGTVYDGVTKDVVSGASVTIKYNGSRTRMKTNSAGEYRLTKLSSGLYEVSIGHKSYESQKKEIEVPNGQTITLDFDLTTKSTGKKGRR